MNALKALKGWMNFMKSVRFSWILTYMLFLILPLITSSVIFFRNEKQIIR